MLGVYFCPVCCCLPGVLVTCVDVWRLTCYCIGLLFGVGWAGWLCCCVFNSVLVC